VSFFEDLRAKLNYLPLEQIQEIEAAYLVAAEAHAEQKRDTGEPYIIHPVAVATTLAGFHLDAQTIMAALLHDVVEDTSVSSTSIAEKFGTSVADLVEGVTKLTQMEFFSHAEIQAESFRKMVLAMSRDIRVVLVKLADRLHNMRTLSGLPAAKRKRIAKETIEIYAPIAHRLGLHGISIDLENLSFYILNPLRAQILNKALEKLKVSRQNTVTQLTKEFQEHLEKRLQTQVTIFNREKHLYSIYKRMLTRHISFVEATKLYALRVIVTDTDSCYRALGIIHSIYKPIPGKFEDYIAVPKLNGYQSLHTQLLGPQGIPVEVQIRSPIMDNMANLGIVSYWVAEEQNKAHETIPLQAQRWINNLLEIQQGTGSSLEFMDNVRSDFYPEEIYVFTPKGDIIELSKGSTVLDFAYAVHSDVGNTCVAAKVDNQFTPLAEVLKSGQTVTIITTPEAKPNPTWLNFVVTARARTAIRNFLKNQQRSEAVALGKELLVKALAELSVSLDKVPAEAIQKVLATAKFTTLDELYEDIGLGNRVAFFVAHQLLNLPADDEVASEEEVTKPAQPLVIRNAKGTGVNFASCCFPIPGDDIVGYLQPGQGLMVHSDNCPNLEKLRKRPELYIPVRWAEEVDGNFCVQLLVEVADKPGSLAALATALADTSANIEDIKVIERSSNYLLLVLRVTVHNKKHLEAVLKHIKNAPLVISASRKSA
jgi:GTP diphosphokinase / guanosine-3',5'-bis(diphosphate) 3'-diphosphatase